MHLSPLGLGAVFCGWGVLVALYAVFVAPRVKSRIGTSRSLYVYRTGGRAGCLSDLRLRALHRWRSGSLRRGKARRAL